MRGALEAETRERGILEGQTESVTSGGFDLSFSLPDVPWDKRHVNFLAHKPRSAGRNLVGHRLAGPSCATSRSIAFLFQQACALISFDYSA